MDNDTTQCEHRFILKGIREAQCLDCSLGVFIEGIQDYERITRRYTPETTRIEHGNIVSIDTDTK